MSNQLKKLTLAAAVAGALLGSGWANAADFYVNQAASNASDANAGTAQAPWKTMYRAMKQSLQPGDVVHVKKGTYDARTGGNWDLPVFNPATSGTADKPITFVAEPMHSVVLDNGGTNSKPPIGSRGRNYIVWDGFVLPNPGDKAVAVFGTSSGSPVRGITLKNLVIHGVWKSIADNTDGIRLEHVRDAVIRNNRIYDVYNAAGTENAAAVKMYDTANVLIEHNEFYDATTGIYDKIQNMNNVYRNNFIHDIGKSAIYFRSPSDPNAPDQDSRGTKVYQNVLVNCSKGVEILPSAGRGDYDTEIFNNTFVGYGDGGMHSPRYKGTTKIYNNIFYRTRTPARGDIFTFDDPARSIALSDYNVFVSAPMFKIGVYLTNRVFNGLSAWQNGTGFDRGSKAGDAQFANAAGLDFHLLSGSIGKGAGRVGGLAGGAVVDAGAYPTGTELAGIMPQLDAPDAPRNLTVTRN
jgi:outer membrane murein-binding lipoprotein Lpp